uniref:Uncharacterized protein n=1 Tax=Oryza meridionalis TaxID=40149 RepID=A0A0E0C687_9ORYZ
MEASYCTRYHPKISVQIVFGCTKGPTPKEHDGDGTNNIMDDGFCTYVFARWIASNENNGRDKDVK